MHPAIKAAFLLVILGWTSHASAGNSPADPADVLEALIPLATASALVASDSAVWSERSTAPSTPRRGAEDAHAGRGGLALTGLKTPISGRLRFSLHLDRGRILSAFRRGGVSGSAVQSWHETRSEVYTRVGHASRIATIALGGRWRVEGFCAVKLGEGPVPRAGGVTLAFRP